MTTNFRTDAHVHIDPIDRNCTHHRTPAPTVEELADYVERERLAALFAIYESEETIRRFASLPVELIPIFWLRNPATHICVPPSARGIKLHPFLDKYILALHNVAAALEEAERRHLFLFIHTEDRQPEFSNASQTAELAQEFPHVKIILAHAGSYCPPGRVRLNPGLRTRLECQSQRLVTEAVDLSARFPNVFLETSILWFDTKARILAQAPPEKLLIGTDFPILTRSRPKLQSLSFQEYQLLRFGVSDQDLKLIHNRARRFGYN